MSSPGSATGDKGATGVPSPWPSPVPPPHRRRRRVKVKMLLVPATGDAPSRRRPLRPTTILVPPDATIGHAIALINSQLHLAGSVWRAFVSEEGGVELLGIAQRRGPASRYVRCCDETDAEVGRRKRCGVEGSGDGDRSGSATRESEYLLARRGLTEGLSVVTEECGVHQTLARGDYLVVRPRSLAPPVPRPAPPSSSAPSGSSAHASGEEGESDAVLPKGDGLAGDRRRRVRGDPQEDSNDEAAVLPAVPPPSSENMDAPPGDEGGPRCNFATTAADHISELGNGGADNDDCETAYRRFLAEKEGTRSSSPDSTTRQQRRRAQIEAAFANPDIEGAQRMRLGARRLGGAVDAAVAGSTGTEKSAAAQDRRRRKARGVARRRNGSGKAKEAAPPPSAAPLDVESECSHTARPMIDSNSPGYGRARSTAKAFVQLKRGAQKGARDCSHGSDGAGVRPKRRLRRPASTSNTTTTTKAPEKCDPSSGPTESITPAVDIDALVKMGVCCDGLFPPSRLREAKQAAAERREREQWKRRTLRKYFLRWAKERREQGKGGGKPGSVGGKPGSSADGKPGSSAESQQGAAATAVKRGGNRKVDGRCSTRDEGRRESSKRARRRPPPSPLDQLPGSTCAPIPVPRKRKSRIVRGKTITESSPVTECKRERRDAENADNSRPKLPASGNRRDPTKGSRSRPSKRHRTGGNRCDRCSHSGDGDGSYDGPPRPSCEEATWREPERSPLTLEAHGGPAALESLVRRALPLPAGSRGRSSHSTVRLTPRNAEHPHVLAATGTATDTTVMSSCGTRVVARVLRVTRDHGDVNTRDLWHLLAESTAICSIVEAHRRARDTRQIVPDQSGGGAYTTWAHRMTIPTGWNLGRGGSLRYDGLGSLPPTFRSSGPALTGVVPELIAVTAGVNKVLQARAPDVLREQSNHLSQSATVPSAEDLRAAGVEGDLFSVDGCFLRLMGSGDPRVKHPWSQKVKGHVDKSDTSAIVAQLMASTAAGRIPSSSLTIREDVSPTSPGVTVEMTSDAEPVFTIVLYCSSTQWHGCLEEVAKGTPGTLAQSLRFIYFATKAKERFTMIEKGVHRDLCLLHRQGLKPELRDVFSGRYPLPPESIEYGCGRGGSSYEITRATAAMCQNYVAVRHNSGMCAAEAIEWEKKGSRLKRVRLVKCGRELDLSSDKKAQKPLSLVACTAQHLKYSFVHLRERNLAECCCFRKALENTGRLPWLGVE